MNETLTLAEARILVEIRQQAGQAVMDDLVYQLRGEFSAANVSWSVWGLVGRGLVGFTHDWRLVA